MHIMVIKLWSIVKNILKILIPLGIFAILALWIINVYLFNMSIRGDQTNDLLNQKYLIITLNNNKKVMENVDITFESECDMGILENPKIISSVGVKGCDIFTPVSAKKFSGNCEKIGEGGSLKIQWKVDHFLDPFSCKNIFKYEPQFIGWHFSHKKSIYFFTWMWEQNKSELQDLELKKIELIPIRNFFYNGGRSPIRMLVWNKDNTTFRLLYEWFNSTSFNDQYLIETGEDSINSSNILRYYFWGAESNKQDIAFRIKVDNGNDIISANVTYENVKGIEEVKPYLKESNLVKYDKILSLKALDIISPNTDTPYTEKEQILLINSFVASYLKKPFTPKEKDMYSKILLNSNETYITKIGDSSEFAVLFSALCRAIGIPSKFLGGRNKMDEIYYWNEVYIYGEGWQDIDTYANKTYDGLNEFKYNISIIE